MHLQALGLAAEQCVKQGYAWNARYQALAREAVNAAVLPPGKRAEGQVDAAEYLLLRGHTDKEVGSMAPEFGKALKLARVATKGQPSETSTQDYGPAQREVYQYDRHEDREFLDAVYDKFFMERPLHQRVAQRDDALVQKVHKALEGQRGMASSASQKRSCLGWSRKCETVCGIWGRGRRERCTLALVLACHACPCKHA